MNTNNADQAVAFLAAVAVLLLAGLVIAWAIGVRNQAEELLERVKEARRLWQLRDANAVRDRHDIHGGVRRAQGHEQRVYGTLGPKHRRGRGGRLINAVVEAQYPVAAGVGSADGGVRLALASRASVEELYRQYAEATGNYNRFIGGFANNFALTAFFNGSYRRWELERPKSPRPHGKKPLGAKKRPVPMKYRNRPQR